MADIVLLSDGYNLLTGKPVLRPWGAEYRFTVVRPDGTHINGVISIPRMDVDDKALGQAVDAYISRLNRSVDDPPENPIIYTESEISAILTEKGYLSTGEKLTDLKSYDELTAIKVVSDGK